MPEHLHCWGLVRVQWTQTDVYIIIACRVSCCLYSAFYLTTPLFAGSIRLIIIIMQRLTRRMSLIGMTNRRRL